MTQITPSSPPPPPLTEAKKGGRFSPLVLALSGCGCLALLCIFGITAFALAGGQGLLAFMNAASTPTGTPTIAPLPTIAPFATPTRGGIALPTAARTATSPATAVAPSRATATPQSPGRTPPAISLTIPPIRLTPVGTTAAGGGFATIRFAAGVLDDEKPIGVFDTFPSGMTIVYAVFDYSGLGSAKTWKREWLLNGKSDPDLTKEGEWNGGPSGTWWVSIYNEKGVTPGDWTLNLYVDGKQVQSGKMRIETAGSPNFQPIVFAEGKDSNGDPVDAVPFNNPTFNNGISEVYAFFKGVNVPRGTSYTTQWFQNGNPATTEGTFTWNLDPNAQNSIRFFNNDSKPLSNGVYEFRIKLGGKLIKLASFMIVD